jgi:hypothetical protein|nr:MAG TPA: Flagellar and Swarming motility protein [Caudoviricetes sp.]
MAKFIPLNNDDEECDIYVNVDCIKSFYRQGIHTLIDIDGDFRIIEETPEEILNLIKAAE